MILPFKIMEVKREKITKPYDIWDSNNNTKGRKSHPSQKRSKKNSLPHPGQSYNPDPSDHKKLLDKILKKELEHKKKQEAIEKALEVKVTRKELRQDEDEELTSGIKHLIEPNANDEHSDGSDTDAVFSDYDEKDFEAIVKDKTVVEKRKTKQQRLKQLKDKLQRKAAKLKKLKNIRLSKFDAIKKMMKDLDKKDKEMAANRKKRGALIKGERLGQKFEQSDPIYCLKKDLPKSLREASCPMDSIVREQLESFQSRLLVEPSNIQIKKRKYQRKKFDRSTSDD